MFEENIQHCVVVTGQLQECFEKFGKVRSARILTVSIFVE